MSSLKVFDPDGDVILRLQPLVPQGNAPQGDQPAENRPSAEESDPHTLLQVSSKVLSLASPVFKSMLYGPFGEGVALAEASRLQKPYIQDLPEDHPQSLMTLCGILHFHKDYASITPSPENLEKLAVLANKYQCTQTLRYCGKSWLADSMVRHKSAALGIDDLCHLLVFAYVVDLEMQFVDVAWTLLYHHRGSLVAPNLQAVGLVGHPLLPPDFLDKMERRRAALCLEFYHALVSPLTPRKTLVRGCQAAAKAVGRYIQHIQQAAIFPSHPGFNQDALIEVETKINDIPHIYISDDRCSIIDCPCRREDHTSMTQLVRELVSKLHTKRADFACLDCFVFEGSAKESPPCRVGHGEDSER